MRRSRQPGAGLMAGLIFGLLAVFVPLASAAPIRGSETFIGSCEMSGTVTFDPPLGAADQATEAAAVARGTCTGTLATSRRTRKLEDSPVAYRARTTGTQSCSTGEATGSGFLRFGKRRVRFTFSEERTLVVAPLELEGKRGGAFDGMAVASGDPAEVLAACLQDGLAQAAVEITGETADSISG